MAIYENLFAGIAIHPYSEGAYDNPNSEAAAKEYYHDLNKYWTEKHYHAITDSVLKSLL